MNVIGHRKFWITLTVVLTTISILVIIFFRLPAGIDFTGGTLIEIKTPNQMNAQDLRGDLTKIEGGKSLLIQESGPNQFVMRTNTLDTEGYKKFQTELEKEIPGINILRHESIGSTVGKNLTQRAIIGFIIASLLIVAYLAYAFRSVPRSVSSWIFGTVAILTLVHDLSVSTAAYTIIGRFAGYEYDSTFVVAVLTILGFSVHDTIVVFDRIRENIIKNPHKSFAENANSSINQTLARSLNTSLTVILVLVAMLVLGGSTIKPFILMLTIGIAIGTYSSIFIASPLLTIWTEYKNRTNKTS